MKDARDPGTIDMTLVSKRGRGRPSTGQAKSAAERMRAYRSRSVTVNRDVLEASLVDVTSQRNVTENAGLDSDLVNRLRDQANFAAGYVDCAMTYLSLLENSLGALDQDQQAYIDALRDRLSWAMKDLERNVTKKGLSDGRV